MVKFNFCGHCDKKILTLPIASAMSTLGDTLIISDDTSYRYYIDDKNLIANKIKVLTLPTEELALDYHKKYDDGINYQYIIYDTFDKISEKMDLVVVARGKDRLQIPAEIIEKIDSQDDAPPEIESKEVVITSFYNKIDEKKLHYRDRGYNAEEKASLIEMKEIDWKWLQLIVESHEIPLMKDSSIKATICELVDDKIKEATGKNLEALMDLSVEDNSREERHG